MELLTKTVTAVSIVLLISCQPTVKKSAQQTDESEATWVSEDLTTMGIFTEGIEGPAVDENGVLYAVNFQEQGTVGKVDTKTEKTELYLKLPEGSIGNSIRFDDENNMFIADYAGHVIYKYDQLLRVDTVVNQSKMNQPNDIALALNGNIYASDPNWSNSTGNLWLIKNREAICLEDSMGTTNGIELHPDGTKLFVNESVQRNVWVYDITEDGSVSNKSLFHQFEDFGMDGMKFNPRTNELFIARYGAGEIAVLNSKGDVERVYKLKGQKPTNLVFNIDYTEAYVTMQERKGIEIIQL